MNNLSIDQTIELVKIIVDNIRCAICDKIDGKRMRYSCGHTACNSCVIDQEDCQICLAPPSSEPKPDDALTQRVKNASVLLQACEDLFNTDVFKRKRLSEQLRIEKELFPKCIQAPVKYENKRKSSIFSHQNKENKRSTYFLGEETSSLREYIMENTVGYVQQWLNKNEKDFSRKPFRDLNVNTTLNNIRPSDNINTILNKKDENVPVVKTNRKRSHFKTTVKSSASPGGKPIKKRESPCKRVKRELYQSYKDDAKNKKQKECDNDESGIFMDSDPIIIIDDSQETLIDKDKNAWLAVLGANKYEQNESTSEVNLYYSDAKTLNCINKYTPTKSDELQSKDIQITKVPFYKKCYITETCTYCNAIANKTSGQSKEVNITIDNDSFTTTIKILNNIQDTSKFKSTNSVSVQTDTLETIQINHNILPKDSNVIELTENFNEKYCRNEVTSQKLVCIDYTHSEDLFTDEVKNTVNNNTRKCLVIEESDSDLEMDGSGPLPVKVDVHRSCDESEYGILGEIIDIEEHDSRPKRRPRGLTPTSTDSSEKENFNPNRMKNHVSGKKKYSKK